MPLISLQDISLNYSGNPLLTQCNLTVEPGDRLCLVGRNGAGKSSLLSIMSGKRQPDSGTLVFAQGTTLGIMPQEVPQSWTGNVFEVIAQSLDKTGKALIQAYHLNKTGALHKDEDIAATLLNTDEHIWEVHANIESVINHLGLDAHTDFSTLSGGKKRRVALARALLSSSDLLLDEPTNHLDIRTIRWLEEYLLRRARTLVFISHDRSFVRRLATRIAEVDRGEVYAYQCGYDAFLTRRDARLEEEEKHFAAQDKKLAQEEAWIRQGIKARRTRNMGRVRALQDLRRAHAARREKEGTVRLNTQDATISGKLVFEAQHTSFTWPDGHEVVRDFSTIIQRGDRVGLIGDNGTGKTTLLRLLLGELTPTSGIIRKGTNLEIAYFDQLRNTLDPNMIVMDAVADGNDVVTINGQSRHVAGYLRDFLFDSDKLRTPVHRLSGGERNRLLLARLFTHPSNLLVLDEPTNDLDAVTLELLEELLGEYRGTMLMVSHDRDFLDNVVTSTLVLEGNGQICEYAGGYTDWLKQRPEAADQTLISGKKSREKTSPNAQKVNASSLPGKRKLTFREQEKQKHLQQRLAQLPLLLKTLEDEQKNLEELLANPDLFKNNPERFTQASERLPLLEEEQLALLEEWEDIEKGLQDLEAPA